MAKIDEERVLVRFSSLVRDTANVASTEIINDTIRAQIETYAQSLVDPITVIVETAITTEANI